MPSMRASPSASQACGSTSLSFVVVMRVATTAARSAPRSEPAKSHDFRPRAKNLTDLLTVAAAELLPHRLDHFPLTRRAFQLPRPVFAEFAQPIPATPFQVLRPFARP